MDLRTALQNIHSDERWWRKILIGGALMMTIVGYPFSAGLVVENMDNARRGYPAPLPPWGDWSSRYLIGLFAWLIDFLYFALPLLLAGMLFLCVGISSVIFKAEGAAHDITRLIIGALVLYHSAMFLSGVSPVGRLIYVQDGSPENAMSSEALREALRPGARAIYFRARLVSLPAYLPFLLAIGGIVVVAQAPFALAVPLVLVMIWLALSALLYAHLAVAQIYVAADQVIESRGLGRLNREIG
ncbi:MAG: DUF4013 domain-containing protein [Chloroflexota bacterium]